MTESTVWAYMTWKFYLQKLFARTIVDTMRYTGFQALGGIGAAVYATNCALTT
jgi:hypothetical protein